VLLDRLRPAEALGEGAAPRDLLRFRFPAHGVSLLA
jgi:hypothetical protein